MCSPGKSVPSECCHLLEKMPLKKQNENIFEQISFWEEKQLKARDPRPRRGAGAATFRDRW